MLAIAEGLRVPMTCIEFEVVRPEGWRSCIVKGRQIYSERMLENLDIHQRLVQELSNPDRLDVGRAGERGYKAAWIRDDDEAEIQQEVGIDMFTLVQASISHEVISHRLRLLVSNLTNEDVAEAEVRQNLKLFGSHAQLWTPGDHSWPPFEFPIGSLLPESTPGPKPVVSVETVRDSDGAQTFAGSSVQDALETAYRVLQLDRAKFAIELSPAGTANGLEVFVAEVVKLEARVGPVVDTQSREAERYKRPVEPAPKPAAVVSVATETGKGAGRRNNSKKQSSGRSRHRGLYRGESIEPSHEVGTPKPAADKLGTAGEGVAPVPEPSKPRHDRADMVRGKRCHLHR